MSKNLMKNYAEPPSGRVILIFEGAIFSQCNHPFYCSFRQTVFKPVFVFQIGPILVVRVKIWALPTILMKNGKIVRKDEFDSSKEASWCTERNAKNRSTQQWKVSEKIKKNPQKLLFLTKIAKSGNFFKSFSWLFQKPYFVESLGFLRCIQCIKALLLSYQNQLFWQFYGFSLKWWVGGSIFNAYH